MFLNWDYFPVLKPPSSSTKWGQGGGGCAHPRGRRTLTPPSPRYSAEAQALDHRCSCCREQRTSQREVTLRCPDGGTLRYTYTHVDSCLCQDTVCELPAQRRARRSSALGVAPGRG